jgi:hypothetical protein
VDISDTALWLAFSSSILLRTAGGGSSQFTIYFFFLILTGHEMGDISCEWWVFSCGGGGFSCEKV